MRIPSQFNEDNLYSRRPRRSDSTHSFRRLFRLVLGLALVIVVMRQASRPAIYQPFFGSQTSSPPTAGPPSAAAVGQPEGHRGSLLDRNKLSAQHRQIAAQLVAELPPVEQRPWTAVLARRMSGRPPSGLPAITSMLRQRIDALPEISDEQRAAWRATIEFLQQDSGDPSRESPAEDSRPASADRDVMAALLAALDDAAAARVVDGSVWRGGDFDLFYRYLDQADELPEQGAAVVGVVPLLQQPQVFRGQIVRIHGTVARAELVTAQPNEFGIDDYWQLWLRPSDGADRPLVAIVPTAPDSVQQVGRDGMVTAGPAVTIVGHYLKRLAYQSSIGADLAPAIVGRLVEVPAPETETVLDETPQSSGTTTFWWTVLIAVLLGLSLAAAAMWQTAAAARRARQLRVSHRASPDVFLDQLRDTDLTATPDEGAAPEQEER